MPISRNMPLTNWCDKMTVIMDTRTLKTIVRVEITIPDTIVLGQEEIPVTQEDTYGTTVFKYHGKKRRLTVELCHEGSEIMVLTSYFKVCGDDEEDDELIDYDETDAEDYSLDRFYEIVAKLEQTEKEE